MAEIALFVLCFALSIGALVAGFCQLISVSIVARQEELPNVPGLIILVITGGCSLAVGLIGLAYLLFPYAIGAL